MKATMAGMEWDVCEPIRGQHSSMVITVYTKGRRIYVPFPAFDAAGRPGFVRVLYSKAEKSIALMPVSGNDPAALAMIKRDGNRIGRYVAAAALCRCLLTDGHTGTMSVPIQWHPDGLLWGDLTMATRRKSPAKGGAV